MNVLDTTPANPSSEASLSDRDWRKILRDIHDGKVIPEIGRSWKDAIYTDN